MTGGRPSAWIWVPLTLAATLLLAPDTLLGAQKKKCRWPGSMWATSAALYLERAKANPNLEERRELYEKTIEISLEGIEKKPDNSQHYVRAAEGYVGLGNLAAADSMLDRAGELQPACADEIDDIRESAWVAMFNTAVGSARSGDTERALEQFERANAIYQKRPEALLQLGVLYTQKAELVRLEAARAQGAEAGPLAAQADSLLAAAIQAYRKALTAATKPDHKEAASFNLAQLLALNDRYQEAADAYRAFLKDDPDNIVANTNLAVALTRWGESLERTETPDAKSRAAELHKEAAGVYERLLEHKGLTPDDLLAIGTGLLNLGNYTAAARALRQVLDTRPYDHDAWLNLANNFFLAEMPDSLLPVAQKLTELYPNHTNNLAFLAHAYRETGSPQKALEVIQRREAIPFEIDDLDYEIDSKESSVVLKGRIRNLKLQPGTPIAVRFEFLDKSGQIVASQEVSQPAPDKERDVPFEVSLRATGNVAGFRYSAAS